MKWLKRLLLILGVLVLLVVGGVGIFIATFNPNAYKAQIEAVIKDKTGRTLTLAGNMQLAIYPWLGLRLNDVSLSNPPGFGSQPFARVAQVSLYVEILPLLQHRLVVNKVVVDGLDLALERNAQGVGNWASLGGKTVASAPATRAGAVNKAQANPAVAAAGAPFALSVAGVDVRNARVTWTDQADGARMVLAPLNLSVGKLGPGKSAPLSLSFHVESAKPALGVDARLNAQLGVSLEQGSYTLKNIVFNVDAKGDSLPNGEIKSALTGDLAVSTAKGGAVQFAPFKLKVNGTQADGSLALSDFARPAIQFKLHSSGINLDRVMAMLASTSNTTAAVPSSQAVASNSDNTPIALPVAMLRKLTVNGEMTVDRLLAEKLTLTSVKAVLKGRNGVLHLAPVSASLYGGNLQADATLNVRGVTPQYTIDAGMQKVQIGDLLKDYAGDNYMTGLARFDAKLATAGNTVNGLMRGLNGQLALAVTDGSVQHSRLASTVQTLMAILHKTKSGSRKETHFASLTGTANVNSGVISNQNLLLNAIRFKAAGHGTADLVKRRVDYVLEFSNVHGTGSVIPLKISGPFDHLGYKIELASVLQEAAKKQAQKELNKQADKLKQELQKQLPSSLKGLF
ncbi:AsmA family protein [Acidihalobacter ferrooxydans]|uniref:AsmA domain-containing protein n=1 Tax=Acidihalobacter ferrooxydans TaxID=1765967 RepID=A0A1P8UIF5_9GAMM|nr:AsmA family protein [Acidihalobacter ferrooxydans]APZ43610.1 hypothetical protein BW247_11370 [Acidihalobacter ferrooxydans]